MAKTIKLTQDKEVIVDAEDYEKFNVFKWYYSVGYANRDTRTKDGGRVISMHRELMNAGDNEMVDHINGNTLDNRKENLRFCTKSTNAMNRGIPSNNKTGYKGVHYYKAYKNYQAYISCNKKRINLGYFKTAEEAAIAYNNAALLYHGEFAKLNVIKE